MLTNGYVRVWRRFMPQSRAKSVNWFRAGDFFEKITLNFDRI
jgi:hypothetical protein